MSDVPIEEQVKVAQDFTQGLIDAFDLDADVQTSSDDDDHLRVEIEGEGVGVLIGRDGVTMEAIRELVKTALQRQTEGHNARVSVDVGGYGARRREALADFARSLAEKALDTGRPQALEPMSPPDRKVVHDAVNEIEGVTTISEGEDPRRRVVIEPA
jgi:spoIIIJ-associated protein